LCNTIEAASGGRFVIDAHPGGGIVPADTEIDAIDRGVLDCSSVGPILWVASYPNSPMFSSLVGGPSALEYYFWYMWGDGLDLINEMIADGNGKVIASVGRAPEVFMYMTVPLNSLDDLKGKRLRLLGDEAVIFGKLGVSAVATPSPELYSALERGVIDGAQHGTISGDWELGNYEVMPYVYVGPTRQPSDVYVYIVNEQSWADLPDDLKVLFTELAWTEGIRHYAWRTYEDALATAKWLDYGAVVEPIAPEIEEAVVKSAQEFYAERAATDPFFNKVYESLLAWRDLYRDAFPRL
jgi:TRAP-type mannitol/chloroaromatic compound transport system substrate-binding protein